MQKSDAGLMGQIKRLSETANGFRTSMLLLTANRLGLFTHLSRGGQTAAQIASTLRWDPRAAEIFLNALAAMRFLAKKKGIYSNAEISQKLLVKGSPFFQGDILNHNLNLLQRWSRAGEVLKTGKPLREPGRRREGEDLRNFINGMANLAKLQAAGLWQLLDLSCARKLLDLGGGPGTYALQACKQHPKLKATVFDLPEVEPIFKEHQLAAGLKQRVSFHAGDYLADPLPGGFDVCLISNIIHSLGEADNRALFGKVRGSLNKGGRVIVKDFFIADSGIEPLHAALFAVNMLLGTEGGTCYTCRQVTDWLIAAGFSVLGYENLTEQAGVLSAEKI